MKTCNPSIRRELPCHGHMFPDLGEIRVNHPTSGKVFTVLVESCGVGFQKREITVDQVQWEQCLECPHFESCQRLSSSTLLLQEAINRHFHN